MNAMKKIKVCVIHSAGGSDRASERATMLTWMKKYVVLRHYQMQSLLHCNSRTCNVL